MQSSTLTMAAWLGALMLILAATVTAIAAAEQTRGTQDAPGVLLRVPSNDVFGG